MAANVNILDQSNFDSVSVGPGQIHVVDFWAEWCGPCHALAPVLEELAATFEGKVVVSKIDVSKNSEIGERFAVQSLPTLVFFRDGESVHRVTGVKRKTQLERELNRLLGESVQS
ncbi:thioredoxin [Mycolicibacterium farcinogenes]|uniref:thioredoxin n=1 Tax=Mycolicibacterium farcinogenes TaxID=1802 RepID=UPI001C8CFE8D|nr:thioredoxin [Mycolicibacterium farcinogenes]QZH60915.1 thioredoxin [Mycolicibacterium farcinogenes]